ncbi:hypothetical protein HPB49_003423 [Dermacentor silvarum]|uniref:Uncharacterized protein n=1 Tax=Dermacentor silvarum TaxID=543639 RepID=A0ACB8DAR8_DERSI|nr:hypothetical protein HPB49_003423 [Dermacentor silvarum]
MEIKVGGRFASYDDFERALRKLQLQTNALFVKKTTKSVEVVNAHLASGAVELDRKLKFANAKFTCKHGGNHRTRGTGIRRNKRTRAFLQPLASYFLEKTLKRLTSTSSASQFRLPLAKPRGCPKCKSVQRSKMPRQLSEMAATPFVQLGEIAQHKLLLTEIVGEATASKVLDHGYIIDEADVEVLPELLPSGLLDYRVKMRQLLPYFSDDAWLLLTSAGNFEKASEVCCLS